MDIELRVGDDDSVFTAGGEGGVAEVAGGGGDAFAGGVHPEEELEFEAAGAEVFEDNPGCFSGGGEDSGVGGGGGAEGGFHGA